MAYLIIPDKPLLYSVLFGTILAGSSSIIVISLASRIKVSEKCSTILSLESAITDILCIVFSLIVIDMILKGASVDMSTIGQSILARFAIGTVFGAIFGVIWLSALKRIARVSYAYMLTLAVVLLAYAIAEFLGGSGSLCSLLFGIMLGNEREVYRMLRIEKPINTIVDAGLKRFESEVAFLLRTFFFVYIGLIVTIGNITYYYWSNPFAHAFASQIWRCRNRNHPLQRIKEGAADNGSDTYQRLGSCCTGNIASAIC